MCKFSFQTNIKCNNCLKTITPVLNSIIEIESWSVDLEHPNHLLMVEGEIDQNHIIEKLAQLGFSAVLFQEPHEF